MKISTQNIARHLNRFERAVRAHEMMGTQHPDDQPRIEKEYEQSKATLRLFMIESIIGGSS